MYSVNMMIETEQGTEDRDVILPAIPQVGDAVAFEREDLPEEMFEVHEVTYRVHLDGTSRAYLICREFE
jgi:hypothetical protein